MLNVCETEEADPVGGDHLVISGNRRDNRYIGWSPTNENFSAEGSWEDWVQLAEAMPRPGKNRKNQRLLQKAHQSEELIFQEFSRWPVLSIIRPARSLSDLTSRSEKLDVRDQIYGNLRANSRAIRRKLP